MSILKWNLQHFVKNTVESHLNSSNKLHKFFGVNILEICVNFCRRDVSQPCQVLWWAKRQHTWPLSIRSRSQKSITGLEKPVQNLKNCKKLTLFPRATCVSLRWIQICICWCLRTIVLVSLEEDLFKQRSLNLYFTCRKQKDLQRYITTINYGRT